MIENGVTFAEIETEERKQRVEENMRRYKNSLDESSIPGFARPPISNSSCVECGKWTDKMMRGARCCEMCKQAWDDIVNDGWEPNVMCAGMPAGMRAMQIATENNISNGNARLQVLSQYAVNFKRAGRA